MEAKGVGTQEIVSGLEKPNFVDLLLLLEEDVPSGKQFTANFERKMV